MSAPASSAASRVSGVDNPQIFTISDITVYSPAFAATPSPAPTSAKALPFYIATAALSRKAGRYGSDRGRPQLQPFRCAAGWVGIGKHTGCPFHRVDLDAQVSDLAL